MTGSEQEKTSEETEVSSSTNVSDQGLDTHLDPFMVGTELDPDALFEQWAKEDERERSAAARASGGTFHSGRHPLILAAILSSQRCSLCSAILRSTLSFTRGV